MGMVACRCGRIGNRSTGWAPPLLRNIRLTAEQARQLASTLNDLVAGLDDAGDGAARHGVLVGLYQPRPPGPDGSSKTGRAVGKVRLLRRGGAPACRRVAGYGGKRWPAGEQRPLMRD